MSGTVVNVMNANAAIKVGENTEIKEVKKDASVTGDVTIENNGRIETSTGVTVGNNPPESTTPGTGSGSSSGDGGGGGSTTPPVNIIAPVKGEGLTFTELSLDKVLKLRDTRDSEFGQLRYCSTYFT